MDIYGHTNMHKFWLLVSHRDVLATVGAMGTIQCEALEPLLPEDVIDRLEQDCVETVWVTLLEHFWVEFLIINLWKRNSIHCAKIKPIVCVQDKMTLELTQVLDDEEKRWAQTLHIEEYQSGLARSVIQVIITAFFEIWLYACLPLCMFANICWCMCMILFIR